MESETTDPFWGEVIVTAGGVVSSTSLSSQLKEKNEKKTIKIYLFIAGKNYFVKKNL
tara:strand:+ start:2427 stop:2597 length:171 start_codon:yes stop_codon:yes gene_type:complete